MRKSVFTAVLVLFSVGLVEAAVQIAPSPLVGPKFEAGVHKGRGEVVYINYDDVHGAGLQGSKRFALSNRFAITPSLGAFHLTGDQTYIDEIAGKVEMDIDYTFASGSIRAEIQQPLHPVNVIAFGGPLFHYGDSASEVGSDKIDSTDTGYGFEAGLQAALKTGPFTTTLFYRFEQLRVKTDNDDDSGLTDEDQTFTFESSTIGVDLQFENGISLSALFAMPDDNDTDDITMIKLGFSF